jgi:hypothetical protein
VRVSMFTSCGGVGQAGVAAVRHTLQLYKSLMRPASLKSALLEQHKSFPRGAVASRPVACCAFWAQRSPELPLLTRTQVRDAGHCATN